VEDGDGNLGFLAAYSGLLADRNDWPYFVPAVFDFQQPDGCFKQEEAAISAINQRIILLEQSSQLRDVHDALRRSEEEREKDIKAWKTAMDAAKARRDAIRQQRGRDPQSEESLPTEEEMTRESQWMKAELRRKRQHHETILSAIRAKTDALEKEIKELRTLRRRKSEALQQWLFEHFKMLNNKGETRNLLSIFADTSLHVPPSGAGECCAPKLLQYAFSNHLRPVCIAEFWWGQSPTGEIRQHLQYYPACRGKCKPILTWMLQGLDVDPDPEEVGSPHLQPEIVYEDEVLAVVNKPAGMLSVPGRTENYSVATWTQQRWEGAMMVHRLDMCTSGLLLVAKTTDAYHHLQDQFAARTIKKKYVAVVEGKITTEHGIIDIPLSSDPLNRPRQTVDHEHGKRAITEYRVLSHHLSPSTHHPVTLLALYPHTGRTHQLRMHCAHQEGLGCPIVGDELYGHKSDRLYLQAESIAFVHPTTGKRMHLFCPQNKNIW
jgi:tRNA pseudouridine32 synthase/23S rRNA pseudouridine746 synthase